MCGCSALNITKITVISLLHTQAKKLYDLVSIL